MSLTCLYLLPPPTSCIANKANYASHHKLCSHPRHHSPSDDRACRVRLLRPWSALGNTQDSDSHWDTLPNLHPSIAAPAPDLLGLICPTQYQLAIPSQRSSSKPTFSYQCLTNRALHSPSHFTQKKQNRQSLSASTSHPSKLNLCVIVAFIFVTARVASVLMSVLMPWQRCMMKAPLSMPRWEAAIKSKWCVRPVQVV
jgi:hypothetical protein